MLLTVLLYRFAPAGPVDAWPGLWQVIFSLGVFASPPRCRAACSRVGVVVSGRRLADLSLSRAHLFSLAMALPFGVDSC